MLIITNFLTFKLTTKKSSSKDLADQSDDEEHDSLNYFNNLLPKTFYRYKINQINNNKQTDLTTANNLIQSTSEHAVSLHNSNTENNLFSNLMNLPSFINTSFSSSALPTTDNVLSKLFHLSPAHKTSSSSRLSSNQE